MGNDDYRLPVLVPKRKEQPVQFFLGTAVKVTGRLVCKKH